MAVQVRIRTPRLPEPAPPFRFPLLATIAPMVAAVAMWLVTGSPFALMFAALGPVSAVASLADSRIGSRRTRRRETARFDEELEAATVELRAAQAAERARLQLHTPAAAVIAQRAGADPRRWRASLESAAEVSVGRGSIPSAITLDPSVAPGVNPALDDLGALAAMLDDAPVAVDARLGVGVVGPPVLAAAVARAIAVQLAWSLSPAAHWVSGAEQQWMSLLPHPAGPGPTRPGTFAQFGAVGDPDRRVLVAVAEYEVELPGDCSIVVRAGEGAAIIEHPDRAQLLPLGLEAISLDEAVGWAAAAAEDARREGIATAAALVPHHLPLTGLVAAAERGPRPPGGPAGTRGLACAIGHDGSAPFVVDLVADGPHAVIGGTTGSGKSELLVAWVAAMAATHPPTAVNFLLVDFKGGSAFAPLTALPHTAGIITDLDAVQAARALASLRAELRHRERTIAAANARDVEGVAGMPRLVIIVDEFAAMLADHPDLHALFADIAARGRSLGVHLVLCTQRPAGVVRDAVLANADLRISLRVNNRADSSAVVGTDAAAAIPASARGRGIVSLADGTPRTVQFAIASPADVESAASRWPVGAPIRRPWCEPLPPVIALGDLAAVPGIPFGVLDLPDEQRTATASWDPRREGNLLVLGAVRSGKSTTLETIASRAGADYPPTWLPAEADAAWDVLMAFRGPGLLLVDDVDSLLSRFPQDHRTAFVERLGALLRDGGSRGIHIAMAAQRLTTDTQQLAPLAPARLLLAQASRQDFVLAGGEGGRYLERLPPGGGLWLGARVQVACGAPARPADPSPVVVAAGDRPVAIVSGRASALAALPGFVDLGGLAEVVTPAGPAAAVIVGSVDDWQSRWGAIAALRPVADILFDGCGVADFRAVTRSRELPPPILEPDVAWRLESDGTASRVRLPTPATSRAD